MQSVIEHPISKQKAPRLRCFKAARSIGRLALAIWRAENVRLRRHHHLIEGLGEHRCREEGHRSKAKPRSPRRARDCTGSEAKGLVARVPRQYR